MNRKTQISINREKRTVLIEFMAENDENPNEIMTFYNALSSNEARDLGTSLIMAASAVEGRMEVEHASPEVEGSGHSSSRTLEVGPKREGGDNLN